MNPTINLNLFDSSEMLPVHNLPSFSTLSLRYAEPKLFKLPEGRLLKQSLCHYLVNIEIFEYDIRPNTKISVTVNTSSIVMFVMLDGHSILYDSEMNILKETYGNCCYMSYVPPGTYTRTFLTGKNRILLLTIPADFLVRQTRKFKELLPVLDGYYAEDNKYMSMDNAAIAKGIFKQVKKLNSYPNLNEKELDIKILNFLLECVNNYNKSMEICTIHDSIQKSKADEIDEFLKENYANCMVNNRAKLSAHFCISEATMLRLAKKRFGKSLHQYIVELRMLYGLKQLMSTDRSIKEIAVSVGYPDPYHFSRAFKRHFNVSPSEIDNLRVSSRILTHDGYFDQKF